MEEHEVHCVIMHAHAKCHFFFYKNEVASQFKQEVLHAADEGLLKVEFGIGLFQVEELEDVSVAEDFPDKGMLRMLGQHGQKSRLASICRSNKPDWICRRSSRTV